MGMSNSELIGCDLAWKRDGAYFEAGVTQTSSAAA
jgi:hypothetical protein